MKKIVLLLMVVLMAGFVSAGYNNIITNAMKACNTAGFGIFDDSQRPGQSFNVTGGIEYTLVAVNISLTKLGVPGDLGIYLYSSNDGDDTAPSTSLGRIGTILSSASAGWNYKLLTTNVTLTEGRYWIGVNGTYSGGNYFTFVKCASDVYANGSVWKHTGIPVWSNDGTTDLAIQFYGTMTIPSTTPVFNSPSPVNGSINNTASIINVSCEVGNVTLWYGTALNPITKVIDNLPSHATYTTPLVDDTFYYKASCDKGMNNGSIQTLIIDLGGLSTVILKNSSFNSSNNSRINRNNLMRLSYNFSDDRDLYRIRMNITNSTGDVMFNFTVDVNGTYYIYSKSINITLWAYGNYTANAESWDSHTLKEIIPFDVVKTSDTLNFKESSGSDISIKSSKAISTDSIKSIDRSSFEFYYLTPVLTDSFYVTSIYPLVERPSSGYTAHIISNYNWVDFESDYVKSSKIVRDKFGLRVDIVFTEPLTHISFNSVGVLNYNILSTNFRIKPPFNIGNYTPEGLIQNITEGDSLLFNITLIIDEDDNVHFFSWFLNGIKQAVTQAWTWVTNNLDANYGNPHNVTVYVNDSSGQQVQMSWFVNVTNFYLYDFYQSPTNISFNGASTYLYCFVNESGGGVNVTMSYRLPDSTSWLNVSNVVYNITADMWQGSVTSSTSSDWIGTLDFRCNATDGVMTSIQSDYDTVNVYASNLPPTIYFISPNGGSFDSNIPIKIFSDDVNDDVLYYDFSANYTNSLGNVTGWVNLKVNHSSNGFNWNVISLPEQSNVKLRGRSFDGEFYTNWTYTTIPISINHGISLQLLSLTNENLYFKNSNIVLQVLCDVSDLDNSEIYETWADCNDDGQWDYLFKYFNRSNPNRDEGLNIFTCRYSQDGNYSVSIGCVTSKVNSSNLWDKTICKNIRESDTLCNAQKRYNIEVNINPFS